MNKELKANWPIVAACVALTAMGGMANAVMDTLQFHYSSSIFPQEEGPGRQYWMPRAESWENKYAKDSNGNLLPPQGHWWYFGLVRPAYQEAFPYSSTMLAWATDGWHLFQMLMLSFFQLAAALPLTALLKLRWPWALVAVMPLKAAFSVAFLLLYGRWLKRGRLQA